MILVERHGIFFFHDHVKNENDKNLDNGWIFSATTCSKGKHFTKKKKKKIPLALKALKIQIL